MRLAAEQQFNESYGGQILYVAPNYRMVNNAMHAMEPIIKSESFFYALIADERTLLNEPKGSVDLLLIDEPVFIEARLWGALRRLIRPEIGRVLAAGTPRIWNVHREMDLLRALWTFEGWSKWHFSTDGSPFMPPDELSRVKERFSDVQWRSQMMAEFVNKVGDA